MFRLLVDNEEMKKHKEVNCGGHGGGWWDGKGNVKSDKSESRVRWNGKGGGWKGNDKPTKEGDGWVNDDWKWDKNIGGAEGNARKKQHREWSEGRRNDRRNEMVARTFGINIYWKTIKGMIEGDGKGGGGL